tara:strand:+ start:718 stop:954 length:237 start_codon:yes stop_codon:yes gene_type:complete
MSAKGQTISDAINISTKDIIGSVINVREGFDETDCEEERLILELAAARLMTLARLIRFMFTGVIITNLVWIANALGYL